MGLFSKRPKGPAPTPAATRQPPHHPPAQGNRVAFDPWARPYNPVEVSGEQHRREAFSTLFHDHPLWYAEQGATLNGKAVLVPDPANPYASGDAVAVYFRGVHVGYLPGGGTSAQWSGHLGQLYATGHVLQVPARVWSCAAGGGYAGDQTAARVTLTMPNEPSDLYPANEIPGPSPFGIPAGRTIQVQKDEDHQEILRPWLAGGRTEVLVAARLRVTTEHRARSDRTVIQVELDGAPVGILSPTQTANLLPIVERAEALGKTPVARALVRGNALHAEIVLDAVKATDLDPATLELLNPGDLHDTTPDGA